jgi:NAD(P)-dependent dehydrogenase (short-subunit alcohol dehydrogenase family)
MPRELAGNVALVTGGGSGIGRAVAAALAAAGARVAVSGRRRQPLDAAVKEIEGSGGEALAVAGDVAESADARRMVEETVAAWGGLHVLVNNAGIARVGPLGEMSDEDLEAVIDVDLKGPILVTRAALAHLRRHKDDGGASVINISSSVTHSVLPNYSVYSAAKAGVDQLTRCWALELARDRVRCNAILPGIVETPIFATMMPEAAAGRFLEQAASFIPLGRPGRPEDVARLALYLAGPGGEWMTGALITLDGGVSLAGST